MRAFLEGLFKEIAAQNDRLFLWIPVAFACGIALYFGISFEPDFVLGLGVLASLIVPVVFLYRHHLDHLRYFVAYVSCVALMVAMCGFLAAQVGTMVRGTPVLAKSTGTTLAQGWIESVEDLGGKDGSRVVLSGVVLEDISPQETPRKVRLRFKKDEGLKAGDRISALVSLDPPSMAVLPGAYDFRRHLFFEGIGGVGFSYTKATVLETSREDGAGLFFERLRNRIDARIAERSGAVAEGIMSALITGTRGAIDEDDDNAMRDSGLYHLLSISGTHVTMVAGVLFFFARFLMVLSPYVALRYPVKKIAAVIALLGAAFYVFLAGADVPAQRSLLMTALVMVAIMLDRSPFSLRLIAFSALVVLAIAPHALIGVSFQMSYAAVAALICFFDYIRPWWMAWYAKVGFIRKSMMYLAGILMTSVIAGTITGLFSLYHFQTFAVYGVLSNMIAVPLTGLIIMPAAIVSLILMPFGLDGYALDVMEWGTLWMVAVAHWTAGLDGAVLHTAQWPGVTYACIVVGIVLFLLWSGWGGKALAVFIVGCGLMAASFAKVPDVYVSGSGKFFGVRGVDGILYVSSGRSEKFTAENWMRLSGMPPGKPKTFRSEGSPLLCDDQGCRVELRGQNIAVAFNKRAVREDCDWADVMVAKLPVKDWECGEQTAVIDLYDAKRDGAHAVYVREDGVRVRSVGGESGDRPWSGKKKD